MERRQFFRHKIFADLVIYVDRKNFRGVAYNISIGGINFVADKILKTGTICKINFLTDTELDYKLKGKVVRAEVINKKDKMGKYGIEFDKPIKLSILQTVADLFTIPR